MTLQSVRRGPCDVRDGRGAEQRLVDDGAGERADLRADGRAGERGAEDRDAGGEQRAADGGAGYGEGEGAMGV